MKRNKRQLNAISRSYANKMKQRYYDFIKDNGINEKILGLDKIKYIENKKKVLRNRGYNIWLIFNNIVQKMVLPLVIKDIDIQKLINEHYRRFKMSLVINGKTKIFVHNSGKRTWASLAVTSKGKNEEFHTSYYNVQGKKEVVEFIYKNGTNTYEIEGYLATSDYNNQPLVILTNAKLVEDKKDTEKKELKGKTIEELQAEIEVLKNGKNN